MSSLAIDTQEARATNVTVSEDSLTVDLVDGRTIIVLLVWYPRLWYGTRNERSDLEIIGDGTIVHWPQGESQRSLKKWLEKRGALKTQ